jgi:hypothetical protein
MTEPVKQPRHSALDRAVFKIVTRGWGSDKVSGYTEAVRQHNKALSPDLQAEFHLIDDKATGLLTHVSMMIAGLGLLSPLVATSKFEEAVVIGAISVCLLIAIGCLRCLSVFRPHELAEAGDRGNDIIHRELIIRRELYSLCIRTATVFTIVLFLVVPVLYFWTPGK